MSHERQKLTKDDTKGLSWVNCKNSNSDQIETATGKGKQLRSEKGEEKRRKKMR